MLDDFPSLSLFSQAATTTSPPADAGTSGWLMLLIVVATFVLPMVLGSFLAKALRLRDLGFKMGVVLLTAVLGLAPFVYEMAIGNSWRDAIRLGIDLAGGTNLVYQIDVEAARESGKDINSAMQRMIDVIKIRIDPSATKELAVRRVGPDRVEIIIPGADPADVADVKSRIVKLGTLEFEILANERDHAGIIREARKLPNDQDRYVQERALIAIWRDIAEGEEVDGRFDVVFRTVKRGEKEVQQVLSKVDPEERRVTGEYLVRSYPTMDDSGGIAVGFQFDQRGAYRFRSLTSQNRPLKDGFSRRLAIVLDNKVHSAPTIEDTISSSGIIRGDFDQAEVDELIKVLNAGALDIPIIPEPISEFTISPTLGADVQRDGLLAIGLASGLVVAFMLVYYLFAGLTANCCLLLNLLLVVGIMATIKAAFTLPGLAGLVLTIGMAVDTNVLLFERMREELARGSSLRMAIQQGFDRALSAIVDSNVTTLIVAVVLYLVGTDQIRGFAVTLFIGLVTSMYSSLYFGRLMLEVLERKRWLTTLKMMSFVGVTKFDFLSKGLIAAVGSVVLIVAGIGGLIARGQDNLDVDFRGGSMVTFEFVEPQLLNDVRNDLEKEFGTSITLERLTLAGETQDGPGKRYRLRTTLADLDLVRTSVTDAFQAGGRGLRKVTMTTGEITEIAAATTGAAAGEKSEAQPIRSGFEGGHAVQLTFSDELGEAYIRQELIAAINELKKGYPDPGSLFEIRGTQGSGAKASENEVRKFSAIVMETRPGLKKEDLNAALPQMQTKLEKTPLFEEVNMFARSVGQEMQQRALMAMVVSVGAIIVYLWFRFQRVTFGLAAVIAVLHDVLVTLGMVALGSYASLTTIGEWLMLTDFRIDLSMIAAFLTIIGYSLNDTIVIFDRIREVRGKNPAFTRDMVNLSVNQTLSRTILTSLTVFIVVVVLYAVGGVGIHGFAYSLVVGVIAGTYSTVFIANPILLWLMNRSLGRDSVRGAAKAA